METLLHDLRYGFRMLRKTPGFTAVAVLTLALGIGANTAIFSVVNAALLRSMPFPEAGRLMMLFHAYPKLNLPRATVSPTGFDYYRQNVQSFENLGAFSGWHSPQNLTGTGNPERVRAVSVTGSLFAVMGVQPLLGRTVSPADDQPGANRVAVLSYSLWQQRFGGDRNLVGREITLDGNNFTVIGVMPPGFDYPHTAQLWVPIAFTPQQLKDETEFLNVVGRLKPGVTPEQAEAEMGKVSAELLRLFPEGNSVGWHVIAVPFREVAVGDIRPALLVLLGAVGCVLLIACANVANLLLARAAGRQKEIAIRSAMGASRLRVVRQLLTEGVLLSLFGGGLGLLIGYWGIDLLPTLIPTDQTLAFLKIDIDRNVLLFTLAVAVVTGLVFASAPAIQSARAAISATLKEGGRTSFAPGHHRFRTGLVIAETALALVLLIAAGLMIRSFLRIQQSSPGFDPQQVLTFQISLPATKYKDDRRISGFFQQLSQRLSALPGVKAVGMTSMLPLSSNWTNSFMIDGRNLSPGPHAHVATASPEYLRTMGIPLVKGRFFANSDTADAPKVVVIDDTLVRAYWPGEDPVGKRIRLTSDPPSTWREVVGVVARVKHTDPLSQETKGQIYIPYLQLAMPMMGVAVRATGDPAMLAGAIRSQVLEIDSEQPIAEVKTMEAMLDEFVAQPRFNMALLAIFAGLALVLAAVGTYGVMAYSVTQRTHEIGLRMALGARSEDVLRLVLVQAIRMAGVGLGIGLAGAFIATRVLATMLYGVRSTDPLTFIVISLLLGAVAVTASYVPARRATKVDPMVALRYE